MLTFCWGVHFAYFLQHEQIEVVININPENIVHVKQNNLFFRSLRRITLDLLISKLTLKAHRQISKKRRFEKFCSCDQACQV